MYYFGWTEIINHCDLFIFVPIKHKFLRLRLEYMDYFASVTLKSAGCQADNTRCQLKNDSSL